MDPRKWKIADEAPDHGQPGGTVFVHGADASFTIEFHPLETRNMLLSWTTTGASSEDGPAYLQASRIFEGPWFASKIRVRSVCSQCGRNTVASQGWR